MKQITVVQSNVSGSSFTDVMAEDLMFKNCNVARISFNDVNMTAAYIVDANLSELVIDGAQRGGAKLRYIGYSNSDDPAVQKHPNAVKMIGCDLSHGTLLDCNLSNANLVNCDITGLAINGVRRYDGSDPDQEGNNTGFADFNSWNKLLAWIGSLVSKWGEYGHDFA